MRKICLRVPQKDAWSACRKDFYPKYLRGYLRGKAQKFPPYPLVAGAKGSWPLWPGGRRGAQVYTMDRWTDCRACAAVIACSSPGLV